MSKPRKEIYISIDMEADGPLPGVNSMLQFGAVFYDDQGIVLQEFCANLKPIVGGIQDPATMKWWAEQELKRPGTWASMTSNQMPPDFAMLDFARIVGDLSGKLNALPVCIAYPAGYDFTWLYWYLLKYLGESCVGFSCLDMKTLGMAVIGSSYRDAAKRNYPKQWFTKDLPHTHNALDDARGQGFMFFKMLGKLRDLRQNNSPNTAF